MGASAPRFGVDVTDVSATLKFPLGTRVFQDGNEYVYLQADEATGIAAAKNFHIETGWQADLTGSGDRIDGVNTTGAAITDNYYFWGQVRGLVSSANVATSIAANNLLSLVADGNGDFAAVSAVTEAGSGSHASGHLTARAVAQTAESGGLAAVLLY